VLRRIWTCRKTVIWKCQNLRKEKLLISSDSNKMNKLRGSDGWESGVTLLFYKLLFIFYNSLTRSQYRQYYYYYYYYYYGSIALCGTLAAFSVSWSYIQLVGLLENGINPSQGRYLHTEKHKHRINAHNKDNHAIEWDSKPQSQRPSERKQLVP
jgi:hypothetical protein